MERTEGKVECLASCSNGIDIVLVDDETVVVAQIINEDVDSSDLDFANSEHLANCWNAFEEGGLVEKLVKECGKISIWLKGESFRCIEQSKKHKGRFDSLSEALCSDSRNFATIAANLDKVIAEAKEGLK